MTPEIAARYAARRIPRYTSYPTAPHFGPAVDEVVYRAWIEEASGDISLYLHIPFCRSMCWYCGCHTTVAARRDPIARYVDALRCEIRLVAARLDRVPRVRHLHFGGGSPTLMSADDLALVMEDLRLGFDIAADAEIAIEIDPRTLEEPFAAALAREGLSRASIGVQSFDPAVQRAINRIQSFEETAEAVGMLRRRGVGSINFDLIYGLPLQTVGSCLETVERALTLEPERLAVFGYAHVPSFKPHQRRIAETDLPDGAQRMAQAEAIAARLTASGYVRIGLDHFALPDDPLARAAGTGTLHRNFQGYTTDPCETLIGLGASAIGRLPGGHVQNQLLIGEYQRRIAEGRLPVVRGCRFSEEDRLRAAVIERLMCDYRVDLASFDAAHLVDEVDLEPLDADGLIERRGTVIQVRDEARALVRAVAAAFDAYLDDGPGRHVAAV